MQPAIPSARQATNPADRFKHVFGAPLDRLIGVISFEGKITGEGTAPLPCRIIGADWSSLGPNSMQPCYEIGSSGVGVAIQWALKISGQNLD